MCHESAVSLESSLGNGDDDMQRWSIPSADKTLFRSTTSRFFCGQGRNDSPFGKEDTVCNCVTY